MSLLRVRLTIVAAAILASCSPITDVRGHSESDFSQVVVGQSRSEDVRSLLGSPSASSSFGEKIWYYITEKKETIGMYAPEIKEQQVTAIRFDADDTVADISSVKKDESKPVEYVEKTTPTEGHSMTILEQVMGNLGRFNAPGREIDPRKMGR